MQAQATKNIVEIVKGSILEAKEKYIVHQTNCVSKEAFGLSKDMFKKFPWADCYKAGAGHGHPHPGSIQIMGNGSTERYVINLFGQYSDKQPMMPYAHDNWGLRYLWFNQGLDKIYKIKDLESVAFNYKIGCGLGGGRWADYFERINFFANRYPKVQTKIYQLADDAAYKKITDAQLALWESTPKQYVSTVFHF